MPRQSQIRFQPAEELLRHIFHRLLKAYGPQHWWPGDTAFEIMVGAILTQNTAWSNVEKAIRNLQTHDVLSPGRILQLDTAALAQLIRPSGYFNIKALRLQNFCRYLLQQGGVASLQKNPTGELRRQLLSVNGVGPETADDMMLYAFGRPVFVIDAYTRRLVQRYGLATGEESYEMLRRGFEQALGPDAQLFNEYHALIVRHAKQHCASKPVCAGCCLYNFCSKVGCALPVPEG